MAVLCNPHVQYLHPVKPPTSTPITLLHRNPHLTILQIGIDQPLNHLADMGIALLLLAVNRADEAVGDVRLATALFP
jgi:hypothetical protein